MCPSHRATFGYALASCARGSDASSSNRALSAALGATVTQTTAARIEVFTEQRSLSCAKGFWCSAGNKVSCTRNTYNDLTNQIDAGACKQCPSMSESPMASTSIAACECMAGYYALWEADTLSCEPCPIGANCTEPGLTFERLPLDEGYWRAHTNTTDVRRCPGSTDGSACEGCGGDGCCDSEDERGGSDVRGRAADDEAASCGENCFSECSSGDGLMVAAAAAAGDGTAGSSAAADGDDQAIKRQRTDGTAEVGAGGAAEAAAAGSAASAHGRLRADVAVPHRWRGVRGLVGAHVAPDAAAVPAAVQRRRPGDGEGAGAARHAPACS